MITAAPHGTWPSPIGVELLTGAAVGLSAPLTDAGSGYWLEAHAEQAGRVGLWRRTPQGKTAEVTPEHNVRASVHEYGGGEYDVRGGVLVYNTLPDNAVHVLEPGLDARVLATEDAHRHAALTLDPPRRRVVAVREDHSGPGEAVTTLVALDLDGGPDETLASGADFYACPAVRADGALAWIEWDHPNMPWDATRLMVTVAGVRTQVAGGDGVSIVEPSWTPGGALVFLSDASGYWNFWLWDAAGARPLHDDPHDFAGPLWTLLPPGYVVLDDHRLGCTWFDDGVARLGVLDHSGSPALTPLASDAVSVRLGGNADATLALLGFADRPTGLYELDWQTGATSLVRTSSAAAIDPSHLSPPVALTWQGDQGEVHGWFYAPRNADAAAPPGELPPLQVLSHGGPTALSTAELRFGVQYWTSRGIAVLDVNYGGSTGYGRAYRDRLKGAWGITDVADCAAGVRALVDAGRVDGDRVFIRGGSAGGYTTLASLVSTDVYAAGISLYGIGDLETLATDTHKFESRYLDGLVAPYPEGRQVYLDRSPLHHLDRLSRPMLILQGADDRVVPPVQAQAMADAVRAKGLPVALVIYPGEGHGFRRADTIKHSQEAMLSFVGRLFGFTPADPIEPLPIDNLAASGVDF
jgi:dipeptidyl aminopeptidase/acylaminoacyl peptidase